MKILFSAFKSISVFLVISASSLPVQSQPTGRAEITVLKVDTGRVKSALVNRIADSQYRITQTTEFTIIAEKKLTDAGSLIFLSSPGGGLADLRVTYTIASVGDDKVRVVANVTKVTHSLVADYNFDANDSPEVSVVQALLDLTASDIARSTSERRGKAKR